MLGLIGIGGQPQLAAQRIAGADRLQRGQLRLRLLALARLRHAGEADGIGHHQAAPQRLGAPCRCHRQVGVDDHVRAQQLARVAIQAGAQAVDEKAGGRQRGHRHRQRNEQEAQLAGAPVARGHAQGELDHYSLAK